jgi:hypothetical protein
MNIDIRGDEPLFHFSSCADPSVRDLAMQCVALQRKFADGGFRDPVPRSESRKAVSAARLEEILNAGADIHGIAEDEGLSNVIAFNAPHLRYAVDNPEIGECRMALDRAVRSMLVQLIRCRGVLQVRRSGHFWYPPGSYMAWHTNNKAPGWRAYLTWSEEAHKSFFRYRDPRDGRVITTYDTEWDLRIFRVDPQRPLWHAVSSETHRYSFGYAIVSKSYHRAAVSSALSVLSRARRRLKREASAT